MENHKKGIVHIKPLSLSDMASAFVVLVLGIGLSILVFIIERISHCATGTKQQLSTNETNYFN
jgi:hypothetical protein